MVRSTAAAVAEGSRPGAPEAFAARQAAASLLAARTKRHVFWGVCYGRGGVGWAGGEAEHGKDGCALRVREQPGQARGVAGGDDLAADGSWPGAMSTQLTSRRHAIRAAAIVADVRLPALGEEAIEVSLEHAEGQTLCVLLPYTRRREAITYGPIRATAGSRRIWSHS